MEAIQVGELLFHILFMRVSSIGDGSVIRIVMVRFFYKKLTYILHWWRLMMREGMVWCGMLWYSIVWYGIVWYGMV